MEGKKFICITNLLLIPQQLIEVNLIEHNEDALRGRLENVAPEKSGNLVKW